MLVQAPARGRRMKARVGRDAARLIPKDQEGFDQKGRTQLQALSL